MPMVTDTREMLLALEPRPESARLARRALHAHGLNEDIEHTVTLLATEIVSNAVRHAGLRTDQRIVFFARLNDDFARVEVADPGHRLRPRKRADRGLRPEAAGQARRPLGRRQHQGLSRVVRGRPQLAARGTLRPRLKYRKFLVRRPF